MSLFKEFLNGLQEGQDVWEQYRIPVGNAIDDFNNDSEYTYIDSNAIDNGFVDVCYKVNSKHDMETVGTIDVNDTLVATQFLEILEECSETLRIAKELNQLPENKLKLAVYDMKNGLETLYKSLSLEEMKKVNEAIKSAFTAYSNRGSYPLYRFLGERSAEWLDEAALRAGLNN